MRSSTFVADTNATAAAMNLLRADAQAASYLLVNQQASPGMTVQVQAGVGFIGATKVTYAGGNSGTVTAPVSNPRIDLVTINTSGTIGLTTGTENASPTAPVYPADKIVLAEIYNVVGESMIFDNANQTAGQGYITDARPELITVNPTAAELATPTLNHSYTNSSGRTQLHIVSVGVTANNGSVTLSPQVDGSSWDAAGLTNPSATALQAILCVTFLVPVGKTYEVDTGHTGSSSIGSVTTWKIITI